MSRTIRINLNRVEGDLELDVTISKGKVVDARCIGTMFRGFEQILLRREAMDALAITPRICGICGTAHLYATILALESAAGIIPAENGTRIRNSCLLAEELQSDCRQSFLMFTPDLCQPQHQALADYPQMVAQFEFMKGDIYREAVVESRRILEIVALFGGQWPHSSYMVPGGVVTPYERSKVMDALHLLDAYQSWFERRVIGRPIEAWLDIQDCDSLWQWLDTDSGKTSAAGLLTRFCLDIGLHHYGTSTHLLMSYGNIIDPEAPQQRLRRGGIYDAASGELHTLDQSLIQEDISHSWYHDEQQQPRHPFEGITQPKYEPESGKYSWAKAPRYNSQVMGTGALAQLACSQDPLITDLLRQQGNNAWLRQFARIQRQALSIGLLRQQLTGLMQHAGEPNIRHDKTELQNGDGYGLIEAARGSLGHWLKIRDGRFSKYQIVTPTAWNASPKDQNDQAGHIEASLIGTEVRDPEHPLEIGYVVRSHDPCLVCTVHVAGSHNTLRIGTI